MKKKKVNTHYGKVRLDELHTLAGKVLECMRNNPDFPNPPVDHDKLTLVIQNFQHKWERAKDGGSRWDSAIKNDAKDDMLVVFRRLSTYVNDVADGNISVLLSSGFYLHEDPKPARRLSAPVLVQLVDGPAKSQMMLRFQKVPYAVFYEYEYTSQLDDLGNPVWGGELYFTSRTRQNIIGPTDYGTEYYARVRTRNRIGASDWSATAKLLAR